MSITQSPVTLERVLIWLQRLSAESLADYFKDQWSISSSSRPGHMYFIRIGQNTIWSGDLIELRERFIEIVKGAK